ncbi:MFS general substrate transporter [Microstroma glucosiphilum]|uniref:MFS general substrate transporter n=1 Tax=Pseudomicrostroma glucosiphilum TaxID=1684307 RepID=A0A316U834_9BASI|nr:MFS general substrate transporter [Pseudomicrostroma glucosiphilum]PWN19135.1 MFS general substrate transporter [Pseudomicrostroma glucosiphilum]
MPADHGAQSASGGSNGKGKADASLKPPKAHDFARTSSSSSTDHRQESAGVGSQEAEATAKPRRPGGLRQQNTSQGSVDSARSFAGDAAETYQEARHAFGEGRASPYFMAVVAFLCSLSQGLPLASMFKVYTFLTCEIYDDISAGDGEGSSSGVQTLGITIPPAPELPHPPQCSDPRVQKTTSAYAAAMATVGALVALLLLDKVTKVSRHFGRKPIMLLPQLLIALAFSGFRISVALPQYAGMSLLFVAVVILEASAGAPLRISIQNYVVDTTTDSQRAAALSFIEGFGQIGAFPSSTIGGFLAAVTGQFFAPFYASIAVALFSFVFILILVPESKKHRHHTLIDDWEHSAEADERHAEQERRREAMRRQSYQSTGEANESYISTETNNSTMPTGWRHYLRKINFLQPLGIFWPARHHSGPKRGRLDWRLLNLAAIVVFEETFQVFLVPTLLLFNSDVFGFDVLQNGYLVSLLQGTRALYLTAIFPPTVAAARRWISARVQRRKSALKNQQRRSQASETSPLLGNGSGGSGTGELGEGEGEGEGEALNGSQFTSTTVAKQEQRGKLDIVLMVLSYSLATASFLLFSLSRRIGTTPWFALALAIIGTQLSSGATNVRTALVVNSVSEEEQSRALAANQVLCTLVYACVPLLTSLVYGAGIQRGVPEAVWIFKAAFAAMAALGSLGLFVTHRGTSARA